MQISIILLFFFFTTIIIASSSTSAQFARIGSVSANIGEDLFWCGKINAAGTIGYFGTGMIRIWYLHLAGAYIHLASAS
jgi:hypothetical protein